MQKRTFLLRAGMAVAMLLMAALPAAAQSGTRLPYDWEVVPEALNYPALPLGYKLVNTPYDWEVVQPIDPASLRAYPPDVWDATPLIRPIHPPREWEVAPQALELPFG